MTNEKKRYEYNGYVMLFDRVIKTNWKGQTFAVSAKKALSNLLFNCKASLGYVAGSKLSLDQRCLREI